MHKRLLVLGSTSENTNSNDIHTSTDPNLLADFPCTDCGRMLHFDPYDDLEGDPSYVMARNDGTGEERVMCTQCNNMRLGRLG